MEAGAPRFTRTVAWDLAAQVWEADDRTRAAQLMDQRLDGAATLLGQGLLGVAVLPV